MSVEYSIGVNNRFGALDVDEEDPEDFFREQERKKELLKNEKAKMDKKAAKQPAKEAKQAVPKKDNVNEESKKEERTESRRGGRGKSDVRRENEKNTRLANGPNERRERDDNAPRERRGGFGGGFNRRREGSQGDPESPDKGGDRERGGFERGRGGRGRGFGGGRGGRGGFGGFGQRGGSGGGGGFGRKREFERRSGSDRSGPRLDNSSRGERSSVKAQEKRDGGGQYNWGNPAEESGEDTEVFRTSEGTDWAEMSPDPDAVKESTEDATGEDKENVENKEEEPVVKEMTLDEWKELREKERSKSNFVLRKAGEGEKKGRWKDTKVLKRQSEDEHEFAARRVIEEKIKTSGRVKRTVDIPIFVNPGEKGNFEPRRGRGGGFGGRGRGARGGGSGRGGRPRPRGGFGGHHDSDESKNFDLTSEDFPTLG